MSICKIRIFRKDPKILGYKASGNIYHAKTQCFQRLLDLTMHSTSLITNTSFRAYLWQIIHFAGSKWEKEYVKAVYWHPAYLTYMQSTSCEMRWMKHKLESRLPGEISKPQICIWHRPYGRKQRGTKEPLDESEREGWKRWLKTQHSKNDDHGIQSHHFMTNKWGNSGSSDRLYFGWLQNHCRCWLQSWN